MATAAGIDIRVSEKMAPKMQAFIADLMEIGYKPKQIHCFARRGHVHGSRHYSGNACDFDQRGWGKTAKMMYHVSVLAKLHGLRDGGSFRDWGHIEMVCRCRVHATHVTTGPPSQWRHVANATQLILWSLTTRGRSIPRISHAPLSAKFAKTKRLISYGEDRPYKQDAPKSTS